MRANKLERLIGPAAATLLLAAAPASAQTSDPATAPITVSGQVTNASSGAGIARALVTIGTRSVMTDAQGAFSLQQFANTSNVSVRTQKPGFSTTLHTQDPALSIGYDLTQPLKLVLYPDGVVTGTVTGADGEPLEHVAVYAVRGLYDTFGLRGVNAGAASTDSQGRFRFRVMPGQYRFEVHFIPRLEDSTQAILPQSFPSGPAVGATAFLRVESGQQQQVDLRPAVGRAYTVGLKVDGTELNGLQVAALGATGESFTVGAQIADGEARINLPSGSYRLRALSFNRGEVLEGVAKVTVSGHDVSGIPMHLQPVTELPVELGYDLSTANQAASAAPATTTAQAFNLQLHTVGDFDVTGNSDVRLQPHGPGVFTFHVPSGRYRLRGNASGPWSVESATYGQTNLLSGEIVVAAGSAGAPIRIIATNRSGKINGTVQPATTDAAGTIPQGWVYLIAGSPSLSPYQKIRISRRGTWSGTLPPGHYVALAVLHGLEADLTNSEVAAQYSRLGSAFEITDGGQATLDLRLVTPDAKEVP